MSGNGGGGGGAARPPPSASMGKLSLEDDKARKGNANGPPGKNLRNTWSEWGMQNRLKSQMLTLDPERIMCHTRIMQTAPLLTQLAFVPQCVPRPLWWGGDSRPSSARTRCQPSTNFERARESGVEIAIAKVCQGQENAQGSQGGPLSTLSHFHSPRS